MVIDPLPITFDVPENRSRSNSNRSNSNRSSNQSEESLLFEEESEPEEDEDEESEERPSMHFIITGDRDEGEKYGQPLHNLGDDAKSRNKILYENKTYYPTEDVSILMSGPTHENLQKYFALEKHYITEKNRTPFKQKTKNK